MSAKTYLTCPPFPILPHLVCGRSALWVFKHLLELPLHTLIAATCAPLLGHDLLLQFKEHVQLTQLDLLQYGGGNCCVHVDQTLLLQQHRQGTHGRGQSLAKEFEYILWYSKHWEKTRL